MEFPRHVHKENGQFVVVKDADQYDACKSAGWADQPEAHVESPQEVRYVDAINGGLSDPNGNVSPSVSELSVKDAAVLIETADADAIAAIEAEESAGKDRAGVHKLIDARKAALAETVN